MILFFTFREGISQKENTYKHTQQQIMTTTSTLHVELMNWKTANFFSVAKSIMPLIALKRRLVILAL